MHSISGGIAKVFPTLEWPCQTATSVSDQQTNARKDPQGIMNRVDIHGLIGNFNWLKFVWELFYYLIIVFSSVENSVAMLTFGLAHEVARRNQGLKLWPLVYKANY